MRAESHCQSRLADDEAVHRPDAIREILHGPIKSQRWLIVVSPVFSDCTTPSSRLTPGSY